MQTDGQSREVLMADNVAEAAVDGKPGFFSRIKQGLGKTRTNLVTGLERVLLGEKQIDQDLLEEIEIALLLADVGVDTTREIIDGLTDRVNRKELGDSTALYRQLKRELADILSASEQPMKLDTDKQPFVILMVGVNGAGKTTTIGKLARYFQNEGKSVMLAAGDTFRAAAVEQLMIWGERNNVPVIAQGTGADSASVIFDALASARAKGCDVLIADTAGRLQNKKNLMDELGKISRVLGKQDENAPHEVMLVLDAGTGQNAISQAREFLAAVAVSGIVLTKLDGTAKGGVIFAIARQLDLPIRFVGVGEQIDDLRPFSAEQFVAALFDDA
ncbi:MAG: signal recognition particle-docking protein FtsY [Gammaproteobacteria bacterium]|nr:signal recognition particle-docking protein FtsY [Gammaproteobacteria bacterium]